MATTLGIDLGGTTINVTVFANGQFLISDMLEIPSRVTDGPEVCLDQLVAAFHLGLRTAGREPAEIQAVGLDTPGPASAQGVLSKKGATNFKNDAWGSFDIRSALEARLNLPVSYLNDGNAAALYAHFQSFAGDPSKTSVSLIIGTGLGGGIVAGGRVLVGRVGFAAELGHLTLPADWYPYERFETRCNCGKKGDLESVASLKGIEMNLLPHFLPRYPEHPLQGVPLGDAAKRVRGYAEEGDELGRLIFRAQAYALGAHIDQMINALDPDAIFIGGGGIQTTEELQTWFLAAIRQSIPFRAEQADLPIRIVPEGDMAGARGSAIYAAQQYGV